MFKNIAWYNLFLLGFSDSLSLISMSWILPGLFSWLWMPRKQLSCEANCPTVAWKDHLVQAAEFEEIWEERSPNTRIMIYRRDRDIRDSTQPYVVKSCLWRHCYFIKNKGHKYWRKSTCPFYFIMRVFQTRKKSSLLSIAIAIVGESSWQ